MDNELKSLIRCGIINLKREKALHRQMIESQAKYADEAFFSFQDEYKECIKNTKVIIEEIHSLLKKGNVGIDIKELTLQCGEELEKERNTEYDAETFLSILLTNEFLLQKTDYIQPQTMYATKNCVLGEYQIILYEMFLHYYRISEDLSRKERRTLFDAAAKVTLGAEPIRKLFEGEIEIAKYLCTPELFFQKDVIKLLIEKQSTEQLEGIMTSLSDPLITYLNQLSTDSMLPERDIKAFMAPLKIKTAALCAQCEKYGVTLNAPDIELTEVGINFMEDVQKIVETYRNSKKKELIH